MKMNKKLVAALVAAALTIAGVSLGVDLKAVAGPLTEVVCGTIVECVTQ